MRKLIAGLLASAIALPAIAQAEAGTLARLGAVKGQVFVNRGNGFIPVSTGTVLRPGDRVTVMGPGSADVIYTAQGQACHQQLGPESTTTIPANASCADISGLQAQFNQGQGQNQGQEQGQGIPLHYIAAGAGGLTLAGFVVLATRNSHNNPSPGPFGTQSSP